MRPHEDLRALAQTHRENRMKLPHFSPHRIAPVVHRIGLRPLSALVLLPILVYAADPVAAQGIDRIRRHSGTESGKISQITALSVTISKGGVENKVPVEDIRWIDFAAEPENLKPARQSARAGRYQDALTGLEAIDRGLPRSTRTVGPGRSSSSYPKSV